MPKLTHRYLESLNTQDCGEKVRDEGGLYGKIRPGTEGRISVTFYYRYRFDGKIKEFTCGTWPSDSLASIRLTRDTTRLKVAQGIDPVDEKKILKHQNELQIATLLSEIDIKRDDALTVQDLFNTWVTDGVRRKDGNAVLIRSFSSDVLPTICATRIVDLTEHDLRRILRALVARGVNRTAVTVRNNLKQMFAWAEKRQPWRRLLANGSPIDLIDIEQILSPEYDINKFRDRVLSADEIRELYDALQRLRSEHEQQPNKRYGPQPIEVTTELAIWIMLSTMCRVGELSVARWENVNFEQSQWFIPKTDVKGKYGSLTVYLSTFTIAQFHQLHKLTGNSTWCFPSRLREDHIDTKAIAKQIGDRQVQFKKSRDGGPRQQMLNRPHDNFLVLGQGKHGAWTPHDLRRTGATMMQALGVSLDVIDRCQNHVLAGSKVRRHYLHHEYADEKKAAWAMLGERLNTILGDAPTATSL